MTSRTVNPIIMQEYKHQQRNVRYVFRRWWWLGPAIIFNMFLMVLITLQEPEFRTRELAIFCVWIVNIAVILRAIAAGTNAISREHTGLTWDSLVLTGISARQILFGKWRAALRQTAPWMFCLGIIRLIMLPIFFYSVLSFYAWNEARCYNAYANPNAVYSNPPPNPTISDDVPIAPGWVGWATVVAAGASIGLTVLEVAACTMLGIACSAVTRRGVFAAIAALCIRFAPIAIFSATTYHDLDVGQQLMSGGGCLSNVSYEVLRYAQFSLADGGTASLSRLMVPLIAWSYRPGFSTHTDALIGLGLATGLLLFLLAGSYFVAWLSIRQTGALPEKD